MIKKTSVDKKWCSAFKTLAFRSEVKCDVHQENIHLKIGNKLKCEVNLICMEQFFLYFLLGMQLTWYIFRTVVKFLRNRLVIVYFPQILFLYKIIYSTAFSKSIMTKHEVYEVHKRFKVGREDAQHDKRQ